MCVAGRKIYLLNQEYSVLLGKTKELQAIRGAVCQSSGSGNQWFGKWLKALVRKKSLWGKMDNLQKVQVKIICLDCPNKSLLIHRWWPEFVCRSCILPDCKSHQAVVPLTGLGFKAILISGRQIGICCMALQLQLIFFFPGVFLFGWFWGEVVYQ